MDGKTGKRTLIYDPKVDHPDLKKRADLKKGFLPNPNNATSGMVAREDIDLAIFFLM